MSNLIQDIKPLKGMDALFYPAMEASKKLSIIRKTVKKIEIKEG